MVLESGQAAREWVQRFPVDKRVPLYWSKKKTYLDPNPLKTPGITWILGGALGILAGITALLVAKTRRSQGRTGRST